MLKTMEIVGLVISVIGTIAAVVAAIYAIIAIRVAKRVARRQEEQQRELATSQEKQQRRRETLQACEALRDLLDKWYRTLEENVNPDQSPAQILVNITKLDTHKQFQHEYSTLIGKISAAREPLCDPLLQAAHMFHQSALD